MAGFGELTILQHKVLTALVQKFPAPQFVGASLFAEMPAASNLAEWDVIKRSRTMAEFVAPDSEAKIVSRMGIESMRATVASIKEKKQLSGSTMAWLRQPGTEHLPFAEQSIRAELEDLNIRLEYRKEWARWQALAGSLSVNQDDVKFSIDYDLDATHTPTAGTVWSNPAADILGDITDWKQVVAQDSGEVPSRAYCNSTVAEYLMKNTGVRDLMGDQLRSDVLQSGYLTRLLGLEITVYDAGFINDSGTFTPFIGNDRFFLCAGTDFARYLVAPSTDPKSGFRPGKFAKAWEAEDPATVWVLVEEHGLPVLTKVENILVADVA